MQAKTSSPTAPLLSSPLFERHYKETSRIEQLERPYIQAREIVRHYGLTIDDILNLTSKFWTLHKDNIVARDGVVQKIITVQCNLVAGTIAAYTVSRPDLRPLVAAHLNFDVSGQFLLNEVDHGCDARNLETTATRQPDGSFILHTPTQGATKFMPPTTPIAGITRIAVVFARLIVDGGDKSQLPPPLSGGRMLDHCLTSFDHVYLPLTAMLGSPEKPDNERNQYLSSISRLETGALALSMWILPFIKCGTYIVGKYSLRRTVQKGTKGERAPIITFRTQQMPILHALAQIAVMESFSEWVVARFKDPSLDRKVRYALGVIHKILFLHQGQGSLASFVERSGAQGGFMHNQLVEMEALTRYIGIAEGEVLVLSIRLASELLLGQYKIPEATRPDTLLPQHEVGIIAELHELQSKIPGGHRSEDFNKYILPHCRPMILAIGQRMAYEAALNAAVDTDLLALYEAGMIKTDPSWYVEHLGLSRRAQFDMECKALDAVFPRVEGLLKELDYMEPYCTAPMHSQAQWDAFCREIPTYTGDAVVGIPNVNVVSKL